MLKGVSCFCPGDCTCESSIWLLDLYKRVQKGSLQRRRAQETTSTIPSWWKGILAFTRDTFLDQNCKQCPVLVTSQTQNVEKKCARQTALAKTNQRNKQNCGCFVWTPGGKSKRGARWERLLEGNDLSSCPPWQSRPDWWSAPPLLCFALFPVAVQWSELRTLVISPLLTRAGLAPWSLLLWTSVNLGY